MAKKSKFPIVPALIGVGIFLLLRSNRNAPIKPPRTVLDVLPSMDTAANDEVKKAVRGQL